MDKEMQFQVIILEGFEPVVAGWHPGEVIKAKQQRGLRYDHKFESTFFRTKEEANAFARSKAKGDQFEEVVEKPVVIEEKPIKGTDKPKKPKKVGSINLLSGGNGSSK